MRVHTWVIYSSPQSTCLFLCQYYAVFVMTAVELEIRYCDTASSILIAHGGFGCLDYFMFLYDAFFLETGYHHVALDI